MVGSWKRFANRAGAARLAAIAQNTVRFKTATGADGHVVFNLKHWKQISIECRRAAHPSTARWGRPVCLAGFVY